MKPRQLFQWFTALLLVVCVWTAYANVLSDDTAVRAKARATVNQTAGCGDDCKSRTSAASVECSKSESSTTS